MSGTDSTVGNMHMQIHTHKHTHGVVLI